MATKRYTKVDLDGDLRVAVEHHAARLGMKVAEYLKHLAAVATGAGMGPVSAPNGARMGPEPAAGEGDDESPRGPNGAETGPERGPNGARGGDCRGGGSSGVVAVPAVTTSSEASPPQAADAAPPPRTLSPHQAKIKQALDLWEDVPDGLRPVPSLVASWFRQWEDDGALLRNLAEIKATNAFLRGVPFVIAMLAVRFQNGKKAPPPLRESRGGGASRRPAPNPRDAEMLASLVTRSGGGRG